MTLYTVWSGEYSDRSMNAVFQSKEKAEKYVQLQEKMRSYEDYSICEYEFYDDKVQFTDEVRRYYYAIIECTGSKHDKGYISTDENWEDFIEYLAPYKKLDYDSLSPSNYKDVIESNHDNVADIEDQFFITAEDRVYKGDNETIIEPCVYPNNEEKKVYLHHIIVYSTESYSKARKIAIEQYQIYTQQMLETDGQLESFRGVSLKYNEEDPWGLELK